MHGSPAMHENWSHDRVWDWGVRLFDSGYYWEAHEAWEHLWLELGRTTPEALLLKGLIKLAACGVKCLESNSNGAKRHAVRAAELLAGDCSAELFSSHIIELSLIHI